MDENESRVCAHFGSTLLTSETPSVVGEFYLTQTGQGFKAPTDLARVTRRLRMTLARETLDAEGFLMRFPDKTYEIVVKEAPTAGPRGPMTGRQNFTIGHELGHFHQEQMVSLVQEDDASVRNRGVVVRATKPEEVETWCNEFSTTLLMPEKAVVSYMGGPKGLRSASKIDGGPDAFLVSREAWMIRMRQIYRVLTVRVESANPVRLAASILPAEQGVIVERALQLAVEAGNTSGGIIGGVDVPLGAKRVLVIGVRSS